MSGIAIGSGHFDARLDFDVQCLGGSTREIAPSDGVAIVSKSVHLEILGQPPLSLFRTITGNLPTLVR